VATAFIRENFFPSPAMGEAKREAEIADTFRVGVVFLR
jgi:hypothetical protein